MNATVRAEAPDVAPEPRPTVAACIAVAAEHYGVRRHHILELYRSEDAVRARHVSAWLARETTRLTIAAIAASMKRDRTTICHSLAVVEDLRRADPAFAAELEGLLLAVETAAHVIAVTRRPLRSAPRIDPMDVASRVLASQRAATTISIDELTSLASALLLAAPSRSRLAIADAAIDFVMARRRARSGFGAAACDPDAARTALATLEAAVDAATARTPRKTETDDD